MDGPVQFVPMIVIPEGKWPVGGMRVIRIGLTQYVPLEEVEKKGARISLSRATWLGVPFSGEIDRTDCFVAAVAMVACSFISEKSAVLREEWKESVRPEQLMSWAEENDRFMITSDKSASCHSTFRLMPDGSFVHRTKSSRRLTWHPADGESGASAWVEAEFVDKPSKRMLFELIKLFGLPEELLREDLRRLDSRS